MNSVSFDSGLAMKEEIHRHCGFGSRGEICKLRSACSKNRHGGFDLYLYL